MMKLRGQNLLRVRLEHDSRHGRQGLGCSLMNSSVLQESSSAVDCAKQPTDPIEADQIIHLLLGSFSPH